MLSFSLLILCLNIDALSYGIANGAINNRMSKRYIFIVCVMSTIMFAIPLAVSKYIFQYFDETICKIINGVVLILLGISYLLPKKKSNYSQNNFDKKYKPALKCFTECLVISVDAIFTALLSGFSENYYIFSVFFYAFSNYFAIFLGNRFLYKLNSISKINLTFISGLVFVLLGVLKMVGF